MGVLYLPCGLALAGVYLAWGSLMTISEFLKNPVNAGFGGLNMLLARTWFGGDQDPRGRSGK